MKNDIRQTEVAISSRCSSLRIPRKKIVEMVDFIALAEKRPIDEVDIVIVGSAEMAEMNREFLDHAGDTDVISFDLSDPGDDGISAQLIICSDVAIREANERGLRPQHELMRYIAHGLLHMMDYDDVTPQKAKRMHARQEELLSDFLNQ